MKHAKIYRYSLPMDSGVILRHTRLATREGLILELSDNGRLGRGEIAPLPEFSQETVDDAAKQIEQVLSDWLANKSIDWNALYPSVAFGFSVALAELDGQLPEQGNFLTAPLCSGDPDELVQKLADMPGQKVAKIKVGMYEAIRDGMVVNMFLEAIPDLMLRLDANRQWTPTKARQFAKYVSPVFRSRIAFLEEPCQTPEESLVFAQETGIALAWDETVRDDGFALAAAEGLRAVVIKPTLVGSLHTVKSLVSQAHALGMDAVISSSLESSFGLNQLARIAHWLTPDTLPGLDTVDLFGAQLDTPWPGCALPLTSLTDCSFVWQQTA
ncbi:o-succinylbenzoate synthase [Enterovibrio norvegicus FF-33]|uniref:o-succinylbenzoate synthase n=1 Tax=Enterovibrio norvegicus TaxID=188144 RepID=UPI0002E8DAA5|nr:o-succinylbenzoate synthase [Enterovibrio norvegicus]OEE68036.1 o-succinylbenzoate synthase [Enterovibrio norvegicus FF-33]